MPSRESFRQIDQDDIRVLARSIEHDLLPVRADVERLQAALIAQAGELTLFLRGEIEQPEVGLIARQVHQALSVAQEAIAALSDPHARQVDGGAVRSHPNSSI